MGSKNSFLFSSNINEAIRTILNFFFYKKILHAQKAQNAYKQTKINKGSVFIRLQNIFIFFTKIFYTHKKHKTHISNKNKQRQRFYTLKKHLYFFYENILHAQKSQNAYKRKQIKKAAFLFA